MSLTASAASFISAAAFLKAGFLRVYTQYPLAAFNAIDIANIINVVILLYYTKKSSPVYLGKHRNLFEGAIVWLHASASVLPFIYTDLESSSLQIFRFSFILSSVSFSMSPSILGIIPSITVIASLLCPDQLAQIENSSSI